jgi:GT2 family glycosyltransferase
MSTGEAPSTCRVSAVVLCRNSARHIEACVRSIAAQSRGNGVDEIWIVDNGSTDGTPGIVKALERSTPNVRAVLLDRNYGTTRARNIALRRASGRYLALVDADAELSHAAFDRLIETLEAHPRAGLVAPALTYPGGRPQLSTDVFPTLSRKVQRRLALRRIERGHRLDRSVRPVDYAISACWLMPRRIFAEVGELDEAIFYSPEDVDYCIRIWAAGYQVLYDGGATAIHHTQELSRTLLPGAMTWSHARGLIHLFLKHRYALSRRRLYARIARFGADPASARVESTELA